MRSAPPVVMGAAAQVLRLLLLAQVLWISLRRVRRPAAALRALQGLQQIKRQANGGAKLGKLVRAGGRYLAGLNLPAWPSVSFRRFIEREVDRSRGADSGRGALQTLIFGITTRCSLSCRHCFASALLDTAELLSVGQLREILHRFQKRGVAQIQWSGGEPLERFDDLITLTEQARPATDCWVLTSGLGLDAFKARAMRRAGMRGVNISLDHWSPVEHNAFRGNDQAFSSVVSAVRHARENHLAVCLSLCATRDFVTPENLTRYLQLCTNLGVGFVQILEPRAVGRFAHQSVGLSDNQVRLLEWFYCSSNYDRSGRRTPVITFHGYHQRRTGCFGGGDRFLYVDARGDIYSCPFSAHRLGSALSDVPVFAPGLCADHCDLFSQAGASVGLQQVGSPR